MKKFFFFLGLVLNTVVCFAQPAPQLYLIGDMFDWNPNRGELLEKIDDGVFTIDFDFSKTTYFSFVWELNENWGIVNSHRYGNPYTDHFDIPNIPLHSGQNKIELNKRGTGGGFFLPKGKFTVTIDTNKDILMVDGEVNIGNLYLTLKDNNYQRDENYIFSTEGDLIYKISGVNLSDYWEITNNIDYTCYFYALNNEFGLSDLMLNEEYPIIITPEKNVYGGSFSFGQNKMKEKYEKASITLDLNKGTIKITEDNIVDGLGFHKIENTEIKAQPGAIEVAFIGNHNIKIIDISGRIIATLGEPGIVPVNLGLYIVNIDNSSKYKILIK